MTSASTVEQAAQPTADVFGDSAAVGQRDYRLLGFAFLLQAVASAVSGLLLTPVDLLAPSAPDDMVATMADIAAGEWQLRAGIIGQMVAGVGIIALGTMMFVIVRRHGRNAALIALGLYLVEVAVLAFREVLVLALWWTSDAANGAEGPTDALVAQATMLYESQTFAYSIHTLAFAAGATIFYVMLFRDHALPQWLGVLGLIAAPLALIGTVLVMMGVDVPLYVFLPNLPFELGAGLWLALRGRAGGSHVD